VTAIEKFPRGTEVGEMAVRNGPEERNVKVVESDLVESATLVALTVTDGGEGRLGGAV